MPLPQGVRLSEILTRPEDVDWNGDGVVDAGDQWIELFNAGSTAVDLGGWSLDGAPSSRRPYTIPTGTVMQPGDYRVFYSSVTGLQLQQPGDRVRLLNPLGILTDTVILVPLDPDSSYSRDLFGLWHSDWRPSPGLPNLPLPRVAPRILGPR